MSLAQGNNTPTRPRIEPGSPDPESDALTIRPVRPQVNNVTVFLLQDIVSTKRLSGVSEKHRQRKENNETKKTVWI